MRAFLAAALMVLVAGRAEAHCYAVWKYPWPQHCGGRTTERVKAGVAVARVAAREETPSPSPPNGLQWSQPEDSEPNWYVEITAVPDMDEAERQKGLDELKKLQQK